VKLFATVLILAASSVAAFGQAPPAPDHDHTTLECDAKRDNCGTLIHIQCPVGFERIEVLNSDLTTHEACAFKWPPEPKPAARVTDKKFWMLTGLNVGLSVAATRSLVACRADHGIGPCTDGGYGPFNAREVLRQVLTAATIPISWKIKSIEDGNHDRHKFWWVMQAIPIGINSGVMIQNAVKHYRPKELE
jgi:hypothetical protein